MPAINDAFVIRQAINNLQSLDSRSENMKITNPYSPCLLKTNEEAKPTTS